MITLSVNVNSNGLLETPQMASTSKQALLVPLVFLVMRLKPQTLLL